MEGCIATHIFFIQHYHLALSGSYLNGSNWTKSLIFKQLHIIHLQWTYQTFTLHDKLCEFLHRKKAEGVCLTIKVLADTPLEEVPAENSFLFEINFGKLTKSQIKNHQYWIIAIQAAITAGRQTAEAGSKAKRIQCTVNLKLSSRTWLGITAGEMQIRQDQMHILASSNIYLSATDPPLDKFLPKRPHQAATFFASGSDKHLCKPD